MTNDFITQWVRPEIKALSAYHTVDPGELIKLDAMENPYTWPPSLITAWLEKLKTANINRYPDPQSHHLKSKIRSYLDIPDDIDLILGNGSDELIQMILFAIAGNHTIVAPDPTFVMYRQISLMLGLEYQGIPLHQDFSLDLPSMLQAIQAKNPAVIFLAYPNNPTGNLFDPKEIENIIEATSGLVIVDEAYTAFAKKTLIPLLNRYKDQLLVMRTLSKIGLAGLRLGILVGNPDWIETLEKIRLPYNINQLTQISAEFALTQTEILDKQTNLICLHRAQLFNELLKIPEIRVYPSDANFILFRTPLNQAEHIFLSIKKQGILIKNLSNYGGVLQDCLRVTIGTEKENTAFLKALKIALTSIS
ncbi:histidinol-phosphate transaminase [Candidatus Nitrosacidococcus tergens]|uniref:Histidinol-phosphate aminotransferase n=1 Tax=Candidatus Nitrosacidococcus tergens TaxID=553981 RepID=A0A7G1QBF2_9GAMM|nr:histidinol-phosphate transaminase [Candidatus Nitrosacidococcus tergens]CAB1277231.1 Histidinol-phosphate aminotransferase [Candidatus Nitrosacidococcus tergens]